MVTCGLCGVVQALPNFFRRPFFHAAW
jgi:hypothetical protein